MWIFVLVVFFITLFQSSHTSYFRINIIYSETITFTIDNSSTIDHIHRDINIHRALSIMFSGLQLMWSADSHSVR